jgi:3-phosphoshikimate 1-carboxyvinyltransferase
MIYRIQPPQNIDCTVDLPPSKSLLNRLLIIRAISGAACDPDFGMGSDDVEAMVAALTTGSPIINVGAAGTTMRFLTAFFAQKEGVITLTGSPRMKKRPIGPLVNALRQLGAEIDYAEKDGFPPLRITGKQLQGGRISLDSSISSQYVSAMMMIAPSMLKGLEISLEGETVSRPYIEMTAGLMRQAGAKVEIDGNTISIARQKYKTLPLRVESDWSAASYWYETVALAQTDVRIILKGLQRDSLQGDSRVAEIFGLLGVETRYLTNVVALGRNPAATLPDRLDLDFTDTPDIAQTLAVTACELGLPFKFSGLQSLKIKETDRLSALQTELLKLGFVVEIEKDSVLLWNGEKCQPENNVSIATYDDHRMAMAFAPACMRRGQIAIADPKVVTKSYPGFWNDLKVAGFEIHKNET